jgi:hypothetical protein|tara:strand:+ start:60 stop:509 length:450 start_codon:yes stop_codon:yes gene_type:complete
MALAGKKDPLKKQKDSLNFKNNAITRMHGFAINKQTGQVGLTEKQAKLTNHPNISPKDKKFVTKAYQRVNLEKAYKPIRESGKKTIDSLNNTERPFMGSYSTHTRDFAAYMKRENKRDSVRERARHKAFNRGVGQEGNPFKNKFKSKKK